MCSLLAQLLPVVDKIPCPCRLQVRLLRIASTLIQQVRAESLVAFCRTSIDGEPLVQVVTRLEKKMRAGFDYENFNKEGAPLSRFMAAATEVVMSWRFSLLEVLQGPQDAMRPLGDPFRHAVLHCLKDVDQQRESDAFSVSCGKVHTSCDPRKLCAQMQVEVEANDGERPWERVYLDWMRLLNAFKPRLSKSTLPPPPLSMVVAAFVHLRRKGVIVETPHPYSECLVEGQVELPGAHRIAVIFDAR